MVLLVGVKMNNVNEFSNSTRKSSEKKLLDTREIQPTLQRHVTLSGKNIINVVYMISLLLIVTIIITAGHFFSERKVLPTVQNVQNVQSEQSFIHRLSLLMHQLFSRSDVDSFTSSKIVSAPNSDENVANQFYEKAVTLMKEGQITQAIPMLQQALVVNPAFKRAREALAVLFIKIDDMSSATHVLNAGVESSPTYYPFIKLKAQIYLSEGLTDKVIDLLTQNMPTVSEYPDYYQLLASAYVKEKQYAVAADIYRQLIELNPHKGNWWFGLGASLNLSGKKNQASAAYQTALRQSDLKPEVRAYIESILET